MRLPVSLLVIASLIALLSTISALYVPLHLLHGLSLNGKSTPTASTSRGTSQVDRQTSPALAALPTLSANNQALHALQEVSTSDGGRGSELLGLEISDRHGKLSPPFNPRTSRTDGRQGRQPKHPSGSDGRQAPQITHEATISNDRQSPQFTKESTGGYDRQAPQIDQEASGTVERQAPQITRHKVPSGETRQALELSHRARSLPDNGQVTSHIPKRSTGRSRQLLPGVRPQIPPVPS